MKIDYSRKFDKKFRKAPLKVKKQFVKKVNMFRKDAFHPQLGNYKLPGKKKHCRSISVTGDWRAMYQEIDGGIEWVEFIDIGAHSELYS